MRVVTNKMDALHEYEMSLIWDKVRLNQCFDEYNEKHGTNHHNMFSGMCAGIWNRIIEREGK